MKNEIKKRLTKQAYTSLPSKLEFSEKVFDNVTSNDDIKKMMYIADKCGSKYLEFHKLKDSTDISTLTSQLNNLIYHPNFPYIDQGELSIIYVNKNDDNDFEIMADFYTSGDVWVKSQDGRSKNLETVIQRRVIHLEYHNSTNKLIISIDPIGDGFLISEDIINNVNQIFSQYGIRFSEYFDIIDVNNAVYSLVDTNTLRPMRVKASDTNANRTYDTQAKNPNDSLSDEETFSSAKESRLDLNRMKLRHDELNSSIELYGKDLLKIWNIADWNQSDGIKKSITAIL